MNKFLRRPRVEELTGFSRSKIYRLMESGDFPKSVKIGDRAAAWVEAEVAAWIESRIAASRASK